MTPRPRQGGWLSRPSSRRAIAALCGGRPLASAGVVERRSPPMSRASLLELLGLPALATEDEIKVRYRELARRFHPDVNNDDHAHARFRAIAAAYQEILAIDAAPSTPEADCRGPAGGDPAGRAAPDTSGDGLDRRRAELRTRLMRCKRSLRRAQADARDGAAKAADARARGDESMARHFERRAEADQSRALGLVGEIAAIEQELELLTTAGPRPAAPAHPPASPAR